MMGSFPFFSVQWHEGRPAVSAGSALRYEHGHVIDLGPSRRPDGIYSRWDWDGRRLLVENDRFGMDPLYYYWDGSRFAISPNLVQLWAIGCTSDIDWGGVAAFLRMGIFANDDTPWTKMKAVPANARLTLEDGKLTVTGGPTVPAHRPMSRDAAIDAYNDLFAQAITRRLPPVERFMLPLSGGRDSRHILAELCKQGRKPSECVTWAPYERFPLDEATAAERLCEVYGIPHRCVRASRSLGHYEVEKNTRTSLTVADHGFYIPLMHDARAHGYTCSYDGMGGDVLSYGTFLTEARHKALVERRWIDLTLDMAKSWTMHPAAMDWLFSEQERKLLSIEAAAERVQKACEPFVDAPNPFIMFIVFNRTRRAISLASYGIMRDVPHIYSPFVDTDVFDLLASQPASTYFDHTFHDDAIAKAYPEIRHIDYSHAPTRKVRYKLSFAERLNAIRDMARYAREHDPRRASVAWRWAIANKLGLKSGAINRKWLSWIMQFEAIQSPQAAQHHLDLLT